MKAVSNSYKTTIKELGREIDATIKYTLNNEQIELGANDINSMTPHYEGNILKSVMKQLDIDCNQDIPLGTILEAKFGVKVNGTYEYISFGKFVVYSSEKQEDLKSYKIVCYDKMLYSMKDYENLNIQYPISIRDYLNAICTHLGLIFGSINDDFVNYDQEIPNELYLDANGESLNYTFRDVLDQIAQATASTICINNNDALEVRYISNSGETIDAEYLKDININFEEKYGPINTITFKRSADADAISKSIPADLSDDLKVEIAISNNQILNSDNRADYIDGILNILYGLEYYKNDFISTGITYLELCDMYDVEIDDHTYNCIMFNDEIEITQGLVENIHTDLPNESITDYNTTTKDDRGTSRTSLIVDKVNNQITSVVASVSAQNSKISKISQSVDEINAKIEDIADITTSGETIYGSINLTDINESEPIMVKVHPTTTNISYLYPNTAIYPSGNLYSKVRTIRFYNITTDEVFDYELPDDLLIYDTDTYDEFYLDYDNDICQITKRCGYNADGSVYALATEQVNTYTYPVIALTTGDYTISVLGYGNAYITCRLMASNIYTTQFATRVELRSEISQTEDAITSSVASTYATKNELNTAKSQIKQTTDAITLEVSNKIGENEVVSSINQSAEQITLNSNRLVVNSSNFKLDGSGNMQATGGKIAGYNITDTDLYAEMYPKYDYNQNDLDRVIAIWQGSIQPTQQDYAKYDLTNDGVINNTDVLRIEKLVDYGITTSNPLVITMHTGIELLDSAFQIRDGSGNMFASLGIDGLKVRDDDYEDCTILAGEWDFAYVSRQYGQFRLFAHASSLSGTGGAKLQLPAKYITGETLHFYGTLSGKHLSRWYIDENGEVGIDWCVNITNGNDYTTAVWHQIDVKY